MTAAIVETETETQTVATRIAAPLVTSSCERFIISYPRPERQFPWTGHIDTVGCSGYSSPVRVPRSLQPVGQLACQGN